jgi:uncharacterized protein (DUF58 family)
MRGILPFLIVLIAIAFFTKVDFFFYLLYALSGIYILGRLWARRSVAAVHVERSHEHRIFYEQAFPVEIRVHNRGWLPVLWLRLSDTLPPELAPGGLFRRVISLLPNERLSFTYCLRGRRRGYHPIGPLVTLGGDLLGTTTYEHRYEGERARKQTVGESMRGRDAIESTQREDQIRLVDGVSAEVDFVIVYPKIVPLHELGFPSQSPFGSLPSRERLFEDPTRIQGVRDYQPGDSLRRMDWKTSAHTGILQVRRYEPAIALETAILLNLDAGDYEQPERYHATELSIVAAASVAVHLIEKRQAISLITNGYDPLAGEPGTGSYLPLRRGREHLMNVLDLLARVEVAPEEKAIPFLDLLTHRSLGLPWGSTVVVVTSREAKGLLDALLGLRRRGLAIILALTCQDRGFMLTRQRASQIGIETLRLWSEQDLDIWR